MSAETEAPVQHGATVYAKRALEHLTTRIAAEHANVPATRISTTLDDRDGGLHVLVEAPARVGRTQPQTFLEQAETIRRGVIEGLHAFAERRVVAVDVRLAGVHRQQERRTI